MSASREKKQRQNPDSGLTERERKHLKEEQKASRNRKIYVAVGAVIAALAIALLVWDSNFFQSRATAVTIDGKNYTAADVQYLYSAVYQSETAAEVPEGQNAFDSTVDPAQQVKDPATGQTWQDYLLDQTIDELKRYVALEKSAAVDGYVLSAEGEAYQESLMTSLDSTWRSSGYSSRAAFVRAQYGPYMSEKKLISLLERDILVMYYAQEKQEDFTYTDAQFEEYYQEHADELDTFVYDQFTFRAAVPDAEKDADGNTIERTDEEKAALLESSKIEMKALAEEFKQRLAEGEDPAALAEEYTDSLYGTLVDETRVGTSVNASLTDWMFAAGRAEGDTTIAEYASGTDSYLYYVARYDARYLNEDPTANVRHALISAGEAPTDEQYAEAKTKAEGLLADWQAGEATEETFAAMVTANSADTGSAANGGLIENVNPSSGYVDTFSDWALDSGRKAGDTGIVQNTGSTVKGWHIMYFSGWSDPVWKLNVVSALRSADMEEWLKAEADALTAQKGGALKYVSLG